MTFREVLGWADNPGEEVMTPNGPARFIRYYNGRVFVEHDYEFVVEYDAKDVRLREGSA